MKISSLFSSLTALSVSALCAVGFAHAQVNLTEGKEYKKLGKPQPTETGDKIEVIEFFSFSCGHCFELEPMLQEWKKTLPADVQFRRVPVTFWGPGFPKIFYAMEAIGQGEPMVMPVFTAIHREGKKLQDKEALYAWAKSKGLDEAKLKGAYEGFSVDSKVKRGETAQKAYAIDSVPILVVDGKYLTSPSMHQAQHNAIPGALNFLIAKARKEKGK
jgi:protein dithiol oxidoreductase (disulfide-forming)